MFKTFFRKKFANFAYFYTILRSKLLLVLLVSAVVGILDSIGLTMFLPLLQLADNGTDVDLGNLNFILDFLNFFGINLTIITALLLLLFVFILKSLAVYASGLLKLITQQKLTKDVRMSIVELFPTYSFNQFIKTDLGKIQNVFLGEIGRLSNTYTNYITMVQGAMVILIYVAFSFVVDWKFALLVCTGGALSNLIFKKINKLTKDKSKNISLVTNRFANILIQYVSNFKYLKASGRIIDYKFKVSESIDEIQKESYNIGKLNSQVSAFREPILIGIICLVILIQVYFFDARIANIMISLLFFYRALAMIVNVQAAYNASISNQGAIDNIKSFINELEVNKEHVGKNNFIGFDKVISLKNITFSFGETKILDNINLDIYKNQTIAFVGESGSGKTTLVNNIVRLLTPLNGQIFIDGVLIDTYNNFTYQQRIGYISQEPVIFNDTIYNNVTFWAPKTDENLDKFYNAINKASIAEFINSIEMKEDTLLGNNGINLSGGQRQRISIAREIYKNIQILILDEATSALDSETEKEIQASLDELQGSITIISIAHRLSTIKNADIIYLLEKGRIEEFGTFDKLYSHSEKFKSLVDLQNLN